MSRLPVKLEPMDLSVTLAFEEDLKDLVFPKVKELSFRVNRHMPVEMAAKLLALKNDHRDHWLRYEFSTTTLVNGMPTKQ